VLHSFYSGLNYWLKVCLTLLQVLPLWLKFLLRPKLYWKTCYKIIINGTLKEQTILKGDFSRLLQLVPLMQRIVS
jgi:hypothetical protein